jgi:serine/threonine protein phosphatase 1
MTWADDSGDSVGIFDRMRVAFRRVVAGDAPPDRPRVPAGQRIYGIGDIHGRADLLCDVLDVIARDRREGSGEDILVTLGDYIDRGPRSAEVLDILCDNPFPGGTYVPLLGNHEEMCIAVLKGQATLADWLAFGGNETLESYGINWARFNIAQTSADLLAAFLEKIPQRHLDFFDRCRLTYVAGDFLFVHAGIRPGVALERQEKRDLLAIRSAFLTYPDNFEKVVVHGHTVSDDIDVRPNRIGIDTGAYSSGHLCCIRLEGESLKVIAR